MGFRDDGVAARARIDALEAENERLRALGGRGVDGSEEPKAPAERRPPAERGLRRARIGLLLGGIALLFAALWSGFEVSGYVGERVGLGLAAVAMLCFSALVPLSFLVLARPDEALVLAGRSHRDAEGRVRGLRIVRGGRAIRMPLLESVHRLDLRPFSGERVWGGVYLQGSSAAIRVRVGAAFRLLRTEAGLHDAADRFLDREREIVERVAWETLEGSARVVLARFTLEALRQDALRAGDGIAEEVVGYLRGLGLELERVHLLELTEESS